jgi:hypothetical protein
MRALTHHDVVAAQLRPHLRDAGKEGPAEVLRLEQVEVAPGGQRPVELDLALDLEVLELDELVLRVSLGVNVGEDCGRVSVTFIPSSDPTTDDDSL